MEKIDALKLKFANKEWPLAFSLMIGFVLLSLFLGYYSNLVIPGNGDHAARYTLEPATHLDFMSEWDGPHYLQIAKYGYTDAGLTAFFPLYPLLIHLAMFVIPSPLIVALSISWLCLFGALWFYIRIIKEVISKNPADRIMGLLLFLFFPTGIFLAATYTESLFALLSLGAVYYALRGRYKPAGLLTALATATHPNGVFIIVLVGLLLWEAKRKPWEIAAATIAGCAGIVGYLSYLWVSRGNPLDFVNAQKHNYWLSGPAEIISSITVIDAALFLLAIAAVVYWWSRRKSFSIYSSLYVLLPIIGSNFSGYSRYSLMAFPVQLMLLAKYRLSRVGYPLVLLISAVFWAYFVIKYAAGYTGGS